MKTEEKNEDFNQVKKQQQNKTKKKKMNCIQMSDVRFTSSLLLAYLFECILSESIIVIALRLSERIRWTELELSKSRHILFLLFWNFILFFYKSIF